MNKLQLEKIKTFGEFVGFDAEHKSWLYVLEQTYYLINKNGLFDLSKVKNIAI